jgi:hypothetical protein
MINFFLVKKLLYKGKIFSKTAFYLWFMAETGTVICQKREPGL